MDKKGKMLIIGSAVWFVLGFIQAFDELEWRSMYGIRELLHTQEFVEVLGYYTLIPIAIAWGIWWVNQDSKNG